MNKRPVFKFFLSNKKHPVTQDSGIWQNLLPVTRKHDQASFGQSISYGEYFSIARSFIEKDRFENLLKAVSLFAKRSVSLEDIKEIHVFLEKHGEFYHPSRIETSFCGKTVRFVLNVAVSDKGKGFIEKEYPSIKKLNKEFTYGFIPKVYGKGEVFIKGKTKTCMFLGQWFDNYNEFHISGPSDKNKRIVVWDPKENYFLSADQTKELYKQATLILTSYYNTETFEQIYPWHHAAGDFVLRKENKNIDLKLITVRQYRSFDNKKGTRDDDPQSILETLLVFFLNLSIKMRLDRIDGVGNIAWSDDIAIQGIVEGFFTALASKPLIKTISAPLNDCFQYYLSSYTESDLYDLSMDIADAHNPDSPDVPVIKQNLEQHVHDLILASENYSFLNEDPD
jgi:hypothetical protein